MTVFQDADYRAFFDALRRLAAQPTMIGKLKSKETAAKTIADLRISEHVRLEIINILNGFDKKARWDQIQHRDLCPHHQVKSGRPNNFSTKRSVN
jgi:hypothetical protein